MPTELETKKSEYDAKKSALQTLLEEAKGDDGQTLISNIKSVENPIDYVEEQHKELAGLQDEMTSLRNIEILKAENKAKEAEHEAAMKKLRPKLGDDDKRGIVDPADDDKWIGKAVKSLFPSEVNGKRPVEQDPLITPVSMRALFNSSSYDPKTVRDDGLYTPAATRPIQFIQRIRQVPIATDTEVYMRQDPVTDVSSIGVTEGGVYNELEFSATEVTNPIRGKGAFIPSTEWVLADDPMSREMLMEQLPMEMMRIIDRESLYGNGSGTNLNGYMEQTGINEIERAGNESGIIAISRGIEQVEVTGHADAEFVIMHPSDWWEVARLQTTSGIFIMGEPSEVAPMRLWGLPVYKVQALDRGEALTGAFSQYSHIRDRQSLRTYWMTRVDTQGNHSRPTGQTMLVGDLRLCVTVRRPTAFSKITNL